MEKTVALVIDVQEGIVMKDIYNKQVFLDTLKDSIMYLRKQGIEIIYIRHNDEELCSGDFKWEIYHEITPLTQEKIFDKKYNSSFRKTGLQDYLHINGIENLILMGLQTEYCIDATCKVAFEYGYSVSIVENANSTVDNSYLSGELTYTYYNHFIWKKRYADIVTLESLQQKY